MFSKKTKSFAASALIGLACLSYQSANAVQMLDRVIAIVDDQVVMQSELDSRIDAIVQRIQQANMQMPPMSLLKEQVVDQLITETLQLGMAKRYGIRISDEDVLNTVDAIRNNQGWTEQQLAEQLKLEGQTFNEFKETIRRDMLLKQVSQGVVKSRIRISEQEVDNFLKSADAKFWISADYNLGHILIPLPSSPGPEQIVEAKAKADEVYNKLKEGANFEQMAIAESAGPAALDGGDLGWRKSSSLPTLFAEIAPTLEVGQVSEPSRSQAGFHILKLKAKRGDTQETIQQTKARHILIKTSEIVDDAKAKSLLSDIRQQVLNGASFEELAKEHSEDLGSKLSGGDLGWSMPGKFVPEFEQTMENTKVGEISQPFASQFGWHIMQVVDRRDEDVTEELRRLKARNLLANRRYEDEVQTWLQELRDNAFIEMKI